MTEQGDAAAAAPQTEEQRWDRSVQQLTESLLTMPAAQRARVLAGLPEFTTDSERALLDRCAELQAERDEARDWVRKLTSTECTLTCVYCGHAYPPGTPDHGSEVLTAHIAQCVRHPMQAVIVARNRAEWRLAEIESALEFLGRNSSNVLMARDPVGYAKQLGWTGKEPHG